MSASEIARILNGRKSGGGWIAQCPAHEDRDPSLSLRDDCGKLLVYCHAGCEQGKVVAALKSRGLWPEQQRSKYRSRRAPRRHSTGMDTHATAPRRVEQGSVVDQVSPPEPRRTVAEYDYCDASGKLLYQVVRTDPKGFFQRRPDGCGGWTSKKGQPQVLYRLLEVLEAAIVFVVEGEKDVEALRTRGFVATTNAGGAQAPWLPEFTASLRGRKVILTPDNDPPGRRRVLKIADALLGHAAQVVVLELEGAKDISEWFDRGHNPLELVAAVHGEEVTQ